MKKVSFDGRNCSISRSLELIGEWWTLLIILEAFFGTRRFSDFQTNLGISKNVLTERLQKLVTHGILRREPDSGGKRQIYRLTEMGRELFPVIVTMMQWGDKWIMGKGNEPVTLLDRATGVKIPLMKVRSAQGADLDPRDVSVKPNDSLEREFRSRIEAFK